MELKHLGGILVLSAVVADLFHRRRSMQRVTQLLCNWMALLRYIRGEIACFGSPIGESLARADKTLCSALSLTDATGTDVMQRMHRDASRIGGEAGTVLAQLSEEFGGLWREEQLAQLDERLGALEASYKARVEREREQWKLRAVLSLCAVLGGLLLIW